MVGMAQATRLSKKVGQTSACSWLLYHNVFCKVRPQKLPKNQSILVGTACVSYLKIVSNPWPVIESGVTENGSCQIRFSFTNLSAAERKRAPLFLSDSSRDIFSGLQAIAVRIPIL